MRPEMVSYMMMFCALLLTRSKGVSVEESLKLVPLSGGAKALAAELSARPAS